MTGSMHPARSVRPTGKNGCAARKRDGMLCDGPAVAGTDLCRMHPGKALEKHKAEGQVVVELSRWGITDKTLDPGVALLRLMTQSFYRAQMYSDLLEQAYEAAERLQGTAAPVDAMDQVEGQGPTGLPGVDSQADRDRAAQDLQRIFATGGVSALIGHTYAADKDGGVFATGEAIRGLVQLEAQERDRAAGMATKAVAAGLATRQVELAEQQGALLADRGRAYIAGVIDALGLDARSAQPVMQRLFAEMLRALAAGNGPLAVTA